MKRMMVYLIAVLVMCFSMNVCAETITTGSTKKNYYKVGLKLNSMMNRQHTVIDSKGSVENIDRLVKDEAQIGLTQMDALAWYVDQKPEAQESVDLIGPVYEECVFIAVNKNGKVKNEDDLQSEKAIIAVGEKGSGSVVTWDYMRKLEPGYKKANTVFAGGLMTIGKLALSTKESDVQAYLFVMKPDPKNKIISTIANNKNLEFIDVDDSDLNDTFPATGEPVYRFKSVPYAEGVFGPKTVKTICMDTALIVKSDISIELQEALSDIVLNYTESLK